MEASCLPQIIQPARPTTFAFSATWPQATLCRLLCHTNTVTAGNSAAPTVRQCVITIFNPHSAIQQKGHPTGLMISKRLHWEVLDKQQPENHGHWIAILTPVIAAIIHTLPKETMIVLMMPPDLPYRDLVITTISGGMILTKE